MSRVLALAVAVSLATGGCGLVRTVLPEVPRWQPFSSERVGEVRRIAVLPFAYRDDTGGSPCSLCPDRLVMAPTSRDDALLVTAFFYEALTRHPRFEVVPYERVRRFQSEATMADSVARLEVMENVDAVVVGALLELRPREGDPVAPRRRAGAALYAALIDARTHESLWRRSYDNDQRAPSGTSVRVRQVVSTGAEFAASALDVAQVAADGMVDHMARSVD